MFAKISIFSVLLVISSGSAFALNCERYSIDPTGFGSLSNAESWYPSNLYLEDSIFKPKTGSKQMIAKVESPSSGGDIYRLDYSLLPNGKLVAAMRHKSGFQRAGQARYRCDLNAVQLRDKIG